LSVRTHIVLFIDLSLFQKDGLGLLRDNHRHPSK
jgi:hypothetical protein